MYIAVRRYKANPGTVDEIATRVQSGFIPIVSKAPGFVAYHLIDGGNDVVVSVSIFEDRAGADESTRLAADWVRQNLASMLQGPPEITAGREIARGGR